MNEYIENRCKKCKTIVSLKSNYCKKCNEPIIICELCKTKIAKDICKECGKQYCYYCGEYNLCDDCNKN